MNRRYRGIIRGLLSQPTAPFHESAVSAHLGQWARRLGLERAKDRFGNLLFGFRHGRRPKGFRPWVLAAHMDHPGFVAVRQRGLAVWGRFYGGVEKRYFPTAKMVWYTPDGPVKGVVETAQRGKTAIFTTVRTRLKRPAKVPFDTPGMWDLPAASFRGGKLHSRACDDLAGLAMAMAAMEDAVRGRRAGWMYLLATRGEEAGFVGALGAVRSGIIPPDSVVLVIETSSVKGMAVRQGGGVIVRVGDRLSTFDPVATQSLCALANHLSAFEPEATHSLCALADELARRQRGFKWQRALMAGGICEASIYMQYGLTAAAVCLALGNYHNRGPRGIAAENVHVDDFVSGVKLLTALAGRSADSGAGALKKRFESLWKDRRSLLG